MTQLLGWLDQAVAWLRGSVTTTAIRWEVLNVVVLGLGVMLAIVALLDVTTDLIVQVQQHRNGGNRLLARNALRAEWFRLVRVGVWLGVFWAFAVNWQHAIFPVAFGPPLYALLEVLDLALNRKTRHHVQRYYQQADAQERANRVTLQIRRRVGEMRDAGRQEAHDTVLDVGGPHHDEIHSDSGRAL